MLTAGLSWLRARLARPAGPPPELYEIARRASIAMTPCTCGHPWQQHEHYYRGTECAACACERFRPAQPAATGAGWGDEDAGPGVLQDLLIKARVLGLTRAWRDHHRT